MLIEMRRKHQTKQAASGGRTRKSKSQSEGETMHGRIVREFSPVLKDKQALGTNADRVRRCRGATAAGNSANAAIVTASVAK